MIKHKIIINGSISSPTVTNIEKPACKERDGKFVYDKFEIAQKEEKFETVNAILQENIIKNTSDNEITINRFSSVYIENIAVGFHKKNVLLHFCNNCWEGEAQWHSVTPYEFGLYPVAKHPWSVTGKSIGTVGSWSTCRYYPILLIEDKTDNKTWYFEHEGGFSWEIELGTKGEPNRLGITVEVNSFNEDLSGFAYKLKPNESYKTSGVVYGEVNGGAEDAVRELLKYKRVSGGKRLERLPVCFNDYMNCLWARPDDKKLIPLIDKAAEVGAEIFCMDDGWFKRKKDGADSGDWIEDDDKFGEYKFSGIIEYIKSKGMKPGVWLEMEICDPASQMFSMCEGSILTRGGNAVGKTACFVNFKNRKVREYLGSRIEYLYNLGIRYIKNDYNHTMGIGCDNSGQCSAYGLMENTLAFYDFIDEITDKFPELIIENCGSGAMRCDGGTLKHFHLQSTSDQEIFTNNPSIIWGMQKCILPEKMGIWAFPFPLESGENQRELNEVYNKDYYEKMSDGEQTVYNMSCAMFGIMYLSGHIDMCDEYNTELIKEGIEVYKNSRDFLNGALPLFVYPQQKLFTDGIGVLALKNDDTLRIGIFKNDEKKISVDLSKLTTEKSELKLLYPKKANGAECTLKDGILRFSSEKKVAARVYEINIHGMEVK